MKKISLAIIALLFALPFVSNAQWTTSGTNIYNSNSGKVGIGTTSPSYKLDVANAGTGNALNVTGYAYGTRNDTGIDFSAQNSVVSMHPGDSVWPSTIPRGPH
ncbi:hypothetical protein HQ865_19185 [Mucilaginibacter mali]|uniref:Uncharacterized protein n=1 Tax=Mucilaginibacter mali TaxID=2740462 RepID=A0A7D4UEJ7_9SPHI|nr:hypothetical protein [Mucilaginibacter mali]QKJ31799.1 hypothetical protein HQ865_19185 [Mucilaginibacter mali]